MTLLIVAKFVVSLFFGLLALPLGLLPSIFLFRDLANGVDASPRSKRLYAWSLWLGMVLAWLLASWLFWTLFTLLIG